MIYDLLPAHGAVCAHRGARSLAPENTMPALRKALECGAHFWETDVQTTADGVLVLLHDDTLKKTTDVADRVAFKDRAPWNVWEHSEAEVRGLDAGSWFAMRDPFGTVASGEVTSAECAAFQNVRIPLLREALDFVRENRFPVNLEIKDHTGRPGEERLVDAVVDMLRSTGTEDMVVVSSFNHGYLRALRNIAPHVPVAALVEGAHPDNLVAYLRGLGVAAYHPDQQITDAACVREVTAAGIRVMPWTVNDPEQGRMYLEAGAAAVCTDYPQRMLEICR